ncbi:hypothetical protein DM860_014901 [Cuscuta australis]|uniref:Uncharacterized protein n=1 Tax=Cuscuta australis TaxID=267555 RepID=A0A328E231_9ASTE|nr:hypothetical protein DM860_014901 [Cuscuta australis]
MDGSTRLGFRPLNLENYGLLRTTLKFNTPARVKFSFNLLVHNLPLINTLYIYSSIANFIKIQGRQYAYDLWPKKKTSTSSMEEDSYHLKVGDDKLTMTSKIVHVTFGSFILCQRSLRTVRV